MDFLEGVLATLTAFEENNSISPGYFESYSGEIELVVKKKELDLSKIPSYDSDFFHFSYRPTCLEEFIGQKKAKELIKIAVRRHEIFNEPIHVFLTGEKGHGKTTLAKIISNMLNGEFFYCTSSQLESVDGFTEILQKMHFSIKYPVLFVDEIHTLNPNLIEEYFYTLLEDFRIGNKRIRPFTLIVATTEEDILANKLSPFLDRFSVRVHLERYSIEDIYFILQEYQKKFLEYFEQKKREREEFLKRDDPTIRERVEKFIEESIFPFYLVDKIERKSHQLIQSILRIHTKYRKEIWDFTKEELRELAKTEEGKQLKLLLMKEWVEQEEEKENIRPLSEGELRKIAKNSRLTPRIAINLLKSALVSSVETTLKANRIIKDGLTDIDLKVLLLLAESERPIGEEAIAFSVGISRSKYRTLYEPYLMKEGFIIRTLRGRKITEKGIKLLEELGEELEK